MLYQLSFLMMGQRIHWYFFLNYSFARPTLAERSRSRRYFD